MSHAKTLVESYFGVRYGELEIGGVPIGAIVREYGTPLYVYDSSVLEKKWSALRAALPKRFAIFYSMKANPNQAIVRFFLNRGCGIEIASGGELHQALHAGCPPEQIVFAGPGKTPAELHQALTAGIEEIHVESLVEAQRISAISRQLGRTARVAVRVNPRQEVQGGAMRMGGKPAPFGIDEEQLDPILEYIFSESHLQFTGIHLYIGTQILQHAILIQQYRAGLEIACRISQQFQQKVRTVDFGGGYGIPYFASEQPLDVAALGAGLASLMEEYGNHSALCDTRFIVEPGRFLVGEAGIYIMQITDIKVSRGKKYLIVDGGMHHHLAASGNLGQVIRRNYPIALLNRIDAEPQETVNVVGPLCTPLDLLASDVALPSADVGDYIGIFQSGAYARTASPHGFLSHPTPPEVWVEQQRASLVRKRGGHDGWLQDQCPLGDLGVQ